MKYALERVKAARLLYVARGAVLLWGAIALVVLISSPDPQAVKGLLIWMFAAVCLVLIPLVYFAIRDLRDKS